MRDIKFRAWADDRIIENVGVLSSIGDVRFTAKNQIWAFRPSEVELMQYTGCKDKNGVEIYEGDIIRRERKMDGFSQKGYYHVLINWGQAAFRSGFNISDTSAKNAEVIGNIYENPELVK